MNRPVASLGPSGIEISGRQLYVLGFYVNMCFAAGSCRTDEKLHRNWRFGKSGLAGTVQEESRQVSSDHDLFAKHHLTLAATRSDVVHRSSFESRATRDFTVVLRSPLAFVLYSPSSSKQFFALSRCRSHDRLKRRWFSFTRDYTGLCTQSAVRASDAHVSQTLTLKT